MIKKLLSKFEKSRGQNYENIPHLADYNLKNKTILLRTDYNVPIKQNKNRKQFTILDDFKIKISIPTIKYLLKQNCKIVIISHLKKPKSHDTSLSLKPIAKRLEKLLSLKKQKVIFLEDCIGKTIQEKIRSKKQKTIFLCENIRFYKEEYENDSAFAHSLAKIGDFYVNEAFSVSHRKHTSIAKLPAILPSAAGFHLEKESTHILRAFKSKRPNIWLLGGAKLDKLDIVLAALDHADIILIGGAICFSFLKAKGNNIGQSLVTSKSINDARKILKHKNAKKIILPIDILVSKNIPEKNSNDKTKVYCVPVTEIPNGTIGLDIAEKTTELFSFYLNQSKTVVINGPVGYVENKSFQKGTKKLLELVANKSKNHQTFSIVGGAETTQMVSKLKIQKKISHISTGGGALLTMLSKKKMPGLIALCKNNKTKRKKK